MPKAHMKPVATKTETKAPSPKISEAEKTPPGPVDETGGGIFNPETGDGKDGGEGKNTKTEAPKAQDKAGTDPEPEEAPKDPDAEPGPTEEELARYEAAKQRLKKG